MKRNEGVGEEFERRFFFFLSLGFRGVCGFSFSFSVWSGVCLLLVSIWQAWLLYFSRLCCL